MMKKKFVSLYNFRSYFSPFSEVNGSFSKLLTRANNYRKILSDFLAKKSQLWFYEVVVSSG